MTIAISGVSGQLGRLIAEKVGRLWPHAEVVGLAGTPSSVMSLAIPIRRADYDERSSLEEALRAVESFMRGKRGRGAWLGSRSSGRCS
jgi:NAD(P)H dehydrogenase (quinone)